MPSLYLGNVMFGSGLYFHAFLYNFYLQDLGFDSRVMGMAAAALTAGAFAVLVPAGYLVDRAGARTALLAACIVSAAGQGAGALVEARWQLLSAAFLAGAGTALWRVSMAPALMRVASGDQGRVLSRNVAFLVGSGAAWITLAGSIPEAIERFTGLARPDAVRVVLLLGAAGTLLAAVPYRSVTPLAPPSPAGRAEPVQRRFDLLVPVLAIAVWMTAPALVAQFFNIYFDREFGLQLGSIGLLLGSAQLATAIMVYASGEAARRVGSLRVLLFWMLQLGPLLGLLALAGAPGVAMAVYLLQGGASPATNALFDQLLLERAGTRNMGVVSSWRNAATEISGAAGAALGGVILAGAGFAGLFGTAAIWAVLASALPLLALTRVGAQRADG